MDINQHGDVDAVKPADDVSSLRLAEQEQQILELYDQLLAHKLEISFLQAKETVPKGKTVCR